MRPRAHALFAGIGCLWVQSAMAQPAPPSAQASRAPASLPVGLMPASPLRLQRDLYPVKLSALVNRRLSDFASPPGRPPRASVRLVLDAAGVPTTVELVRGSGLAAFDAAVVEAIASFDQARPMPLPTDEARLREVTGPGLVLEVFANAAVVPSTPTPSDSK